MPFYFSVALMLHFLCTNYQDDISNPGADAELIKIAAFSKSAIQFCKQYNYNGSVFFLVDMSIHSGKKRFFVVDMNADSVLAAGLVAHGACGPFFSATASFSNEPNFYCSSLGRYKIGNKYAGRFGTAYKLYGLDSTNSNAFKRNVVLHSYYEVPDEEIYPGRVCNSQGCPMVSKNFLKQLALYIDASKNPILLRIVS